jgi:branched-chain amino acid transport system substrate-binding protein
VLYTYAAFQVWAQAAAKAGTVDPQKVAATMRAGTWDTVLGPISFDKKGDITAGGWAVYRWDKDGNYEEIYTSGPS